MAEDWREAFEQARSDQPTERRLQQRRVATALRQVIERVVATGAPADILSDLADALEGTATSLAQHPQAWLYEGFAESANAGTARAFFDHSPFLGAAHPLAPPMEVEAEDDRIVGHVRFGSAYEGPPGCVHGGYVAAIFDELLGLAQSIGGRPGMTARLTVNYRSPTPLHTDLRLEGELTRVEGRKIFTVGRCFAGSILTAEAEGLFVTVDPARFEQLLEDRQRRGGAESAPVP